MRSRDFKSNPHLAYLLDLFRNKKRTDGRNWEEFRAFDVNFDRPSNTSIASLGRTRVMCTLGVVIATPRKSTRPGSGSIAFTMDFLPMAHPSAIESNSSDTEVEQCLVMLESLYRDTYCIDFETLCIEANKFVFEIKCALKVLDYDGGLFDCCTLAVSTALAHFRRNDVSYDPITQKLISHATNKPSIPLTIYYKPFTTTFGFIQGIEEPIMDPTLQESLLVDGFLIIGANHREEICLIYQCGNLKIEPKMIERCSDFALRNVKKLSKETVKQPT